MRRNYRGILAYFRDNPGIFIFMVLVVFTGTICGVLLVQLLDESRLMGVTTALGHFFNDLKEEKVDLLNSPGLLWSSYYKNGAILLLIWALGLFSAGFMPVLVLLFLKGFSLGFTGGFIIYRYSLKGVLFCLAALIPHNLFFVPAFIIAAAFAFAHSCYLFKNRFKKMGLSEHPFLKQYCICMAAALMVIMFGGLVESYITPVFIRLVLPAI